MIPICFAAWACWVHDVMLWCRAQLWFPYWHIPCKVWITFSVFSFDSQEKMCTCSDDLCGGYSTYEKYDLYRLKTCILKLPCLYSKNCLCTRYLPHGRRTVVLEDGVHWDRVRAPPVDTLAHDLHTSDCLHELRPGDHIEIQWRRNKEFPYGMFPSTQQGLL